MARSTLRDEEPIAQLRYWLNSNSKYSIPPKALPVLVCLKNTPLSFALCCIYLSTRLLVLYFPYKLAAVP